MFAAAAPVARPSATHAGEPPKTSAGVGEIPPPHAGRAPATTRQAAGQPHELDPERLAHNERKSYREALIQHERHQA